MQSLLSVKKYKKEDGNVKKHNTTDGQVTKTTQNSDSKFIDKDTALYLNGEYIGNMQSVEVGTRCDCPIKNSRHSDGVGLDYAKVVQLAGGEHGVFCSGDGCQCTYIPEQELTQEKKEEWLKKKSEQNNKDQLPKKKTQQSFNKTSALDIIKAKATKHSDLVARYNMEMIYDGFLASGMHTFLYGPSGSMKSTIVSSIMLSAELSSKYKIHYWAFDTDPAFNMAFSNIVNAKGLQENVLLLEDITPDDFKKLYENVIAQKEDLHNFIIVIDTYKFVAGADVNDKKINAKTMHFIKELCKLGACVLSLGHTNKDGKRNSGTAEIEQDSDAIMRIDAVDNGNERIATIKKAGRVRFAYHDPITFKAKLSTDKSATLEERSQSLILSVTKEKDYLDVESLLNMKNAREEDADLIDLVTDTLIQADGKMRLTMLVDEVHGSEMNAGYSKAVIRKKLDFYKNQEWYFHKNPDSQKGVLVSLDDNTDELIESIRNKIHNSGAKNENESEVF